MIYDVFYYFPNGRLFAGFDAQVTYEYLKNTLIGKTGGRTYAIAQNIDTDHHKICISPSGVVVDYESLPWVIAAAKEEKREKEERERKTIQRGYGIMSRLGAKVVRVSDARLVYLNKGESPVTLSQIKQASQQEDTGDGLVPFYKAMLDAAEKHIARNQRAARDDSDD